MLVAVVRPESAIVAVVRPESAIVAVGLVVNFHIDNSHIQRQFKSCVICFVAELDLNLPVPNNL